MDFNALGYTRIISMIYSLYFMCCYAVEICVGIDEKEIHKQDRNRARTNRWLRDREKAEQHSF